MEVLKKLYQLLLRLMELLAVITLAGMVLIVFWSVLSRFVFNSSIAWAEETSRFLMIWLTLVGSVVAYEENKHVGFDSIVNMLPRVPRLLITLLSYILVFGILLILIRGGVALAKNQWSWTSPATKTSYGFVYAIAPVSFGIMAIQAVIKFICAILEFRKSRKERR